MISGTPARVLDIGCSTGALGGVLHDAGAWVWGIEVDPIRAQKASSRLDGVSIAEAETAIGDLASRGILFDLVICADSLEHMVRPDIVLRHAVELLSPQGQVLISLPNVRFYTTITSLLIGCSWPRKDRGVHDRTHLHWYTKSDAQQLIADSGLTIHEVRAHYRLLDAPARLNRLADFMAVPGLRGLLAYQYLFSARRS